MHSTISSSLPIQSITCSIFTNKTDAHPRYTSIDIWSSNAHHRTILRACMNIKAAPKSQKSRDQRLFHRTQKYPSQHITRERDDSLKNQPGVQCPLSLAFSNRKRRIGLPLYPFPAGAAAAHLFAPFSLFLHAYTFVGAALSHVPYLPICRHTTGRLKAPAYPSCVRKSHTGGGGGARTFKFLKGRASAKVRPIKYLSIRIDIRDDARVRVCACMCVTSVSVFVIFIRWE